MLPPDWLDRVLGGLPPESQIAQRNAAISAIYAQLFLRDPESFYWAGLAAFASFRVGLLLAVYDFAYERMESQTDEKVEEVMNDARLLTNLEMIRKTNNEVFRSAGVAHLAYWASGGQLEAVAETANRRWTEPLLGEGFGISTSVGSSSLEERKPPQRPASGVGRNSSWTTSSV